MNTELYAYLAAVLAVGLIVTWFQLIKAVKTPADRRGFLAAYVVALCLGFYALAAGAGWLVGAAAVIAILISGCQLIFMSQSKQNVLPAVAVGDSIINFTAPDENGELFDLASLDGRPFLLKFFRGHF